MQKIPHNILEKFLSIERLGKYLSMAGNDHAKAVSLYLENLNKCQTLYINLHWLEIGLRNAINRQLSARFGNEWYNNPKLILEEIEQSHVRNAQDRLLKDGKDVSNGNMVATLSFGFWVNLFNKPYENLWRICISRSFPARHASIDRKEMRKKLHPLLRLRNRIAHYEPILQHKLPQAKQDIVDIVHWIEPNMPEIP